MRIFFPIAILTLAALSGYTGLPCPLPRFLSTGDSCDQKIAETPHSVQATQQFLTRDPSETLILEDPNGDRDQDGVMNLLDLYPDDPDQWFQMIPDGDSTSTDSSQEPQPQDLESSSDTHPLLL